MIRSHPNPSFYMGFYDETGAEVYRHTLNPVVVTSGDFLEYRLAEGDVSFTPDRAITVVRIDIVSPELEYRRELPIAGRGKMKPEHILSGQTLTIAV